MVFAFQWQRTPHSTRPTTPLPLPVLLDTVHCSPYYTSIIDRSEYKSWSTPACKNLVPVSFHSAHLRTSTSPVVIRRPACFRHVLPLPPSPRPIPPSSHPPPPPKATSYATMHVVPTRVRMRTTRATRITPLSTCGPPHHRGPLPHLPLTAPAPTVFHCPITCCSIHIPSTLIPMIAPHCPSAAAPLVLPMSH